VQEAAAGGDDFPLFRTFGKGFVYYAGDKGEAQRHGLHGGA